MLTEEEIKTFYTQIILFSGVGKGKSGLGTVKFTRGYITINICQKKSQNTLRVNFPVHKLKVETLRTLLSLLFDR